jgi:hypothetical protein
MYAMACVGRCLGLVTHGRESTKQAAADKVAETYAAGLERCARFTSRSGNV